MIYFVNRDGRICIFYAVDGKVIAGATDIPTDDPDAACDEGEVDYLLKSMRQAFPSIHVDRSHVVFRFCGVRPLPRSNALTPGQISRDHSFPVLPAGNGIDFPDLLAGGRKVDHLPRACRAGCRRDSASAGPPARAQLGGCSDRRRQGLSPAAAGHRTATGAAAGPGGTLWHRRGSRRCLYAGGPGCAAPLPPRLLTPGDRISLRSTSESFTSTT